MERERILVVDDEANARNALRELLSDAGYEVAVAGSGEEALAVIDRFHPKVLLTDVRMPRMSGIELARATRALPDSPRVIFMSACFPPANRDEEVWLPKPLDVDRLLDTLGGVLAA